MTRLTPLQLDAILVLQLTVAWAGESAGEPPRLGWWKTDLVDAKGGGDLFSRLVPKTAPWASLVLVREAARRVDEAARRKMARADAVWTLFHLGFAVDEQLAERLSFHRRHRDDPAVALGAAYVADRPWSRASFETLLGGLGQAKVERSPAGRRLTVKACAAPELAPLLAGALLPVTAEYPVPFVEAPG
ncbi:MAG: BREX-6 system BrxE protein [Gemmatimonadaceae bacterium]